MQHLFKRAGLFGGLGAVATYAGCCLYMFARQQHLLYQPEKSMDKDSANPVFLDELERGGWIDNPNQPKAIIYYGGSSEVVQRRRKMMSEFSDFTRYFIPYRGFWPNEHMTPTEPALKEDALKLFDFVRHRHDEVSIVGRSLGTSIALHVGAEREHHKMVLITPFDSILNIAKKKYKIFPVQKILRDRHEAHKDAKRIVRPTSVFLAQTDRVTPFESWQKLKENFAIPLEEWTVDKTDHTTIVEDKDMWSRIQNFLNTPVADLPFGNVASSFSQTLSEINDSIQAGKMRSKENKRQKTPQSKSEPKQANQTPIHASEIKGSEPKKLSKRHSPPPHPSDRLSDRLSDHPDREPPKIV